MISELQNISSSLCFIPWRNSGSKKGAMDDKSVQCGMIFPRNLMQVCAHKWASNLAPYIDSQIRQLRKQRLRGEAWVTCEVTYNRVKQKKTKRMMDEEGMIFSSVCPRRSDYLSFLDKLREVEVSSATSHYSFLPICKDDPRNFCANIDLALKICASSLSENSDGKSHDMTGCNHKFGTDLAMFLKLRKVFEWSVYIYGKHEVSFKKALVEPIFC